MLAYSVQAFEVAKTSKTGGFRTETFDPILSWSFVSILNVICQTWPPLISWCGRTIVGPVSFGPDDPTKKPSLVIILLSGIFPD
jgi:hypothetical protein